jgi:phospho-N-acetylmuramoyl-pentapeptide-transferase
MDGLAAGCTVIVAAVFLIISQIVGVRAWANFFHLPLVVGAEEMTIVCAAVLGSCVGFLWYNAHPAQVFMGDTGSLPLGGLLGYIAVVTRQESLLVIAGGVFVMEALSVLLQVSYFKLTKPKPGMQGIRLFRCAPLHHHFHLGGWAESKVVVRFWLLGIIFAALALATLKLR